jgi:aryl-alcohol dehydrogenase-like predicted oxidoreductase
MKYRKLGNTNLSVSEISIGCSGYWGNSRFSEKQAHKVIWEAFDRGVNFFDTGHNYCKFNAEPRLGRVVKEILGSNDRSRIVIATKAGTVVPSASILPGSRNKQKDFSPDSIEASCNKSIANLHCDYLDIFYLHGISESEISDSLVNRLYQMKKNGMFRYLGINTHTQSDMLFASRHPEIFDVALIDYNVLQLDREPTIDALDRSGIGVIAGTVLAQGHLINGKIGSLKSSADLWYLARALLKGTGRRLAGSSREMQKTLSSIAGMSAAQAAFAYILQNSSVASCVFGTTNIENLTEVLASVEVKLPEDSRFFIRSSFESLGVKISQ